MDVFVSSGEGKPKESEFRITVYKRELDTQYNLKIKSARAFFTEVNKRFPTLPFAIRAFEDTTMAKIGVIECTKHDLLTPYPCLIEKPGEFVAQFKTTVAVLPRSTVVLAGNAPFNAERFETEKKITNEAVLAVLTGDLWKKDDKKKTEKVEEKAKE